MYHICMKNKKSTISLLLIALLVLYIILAFTPLSTELQLTPQWTLDITEQPAQNDSSLNVLPFKLGQNSGYFTHDGKLAFINNFDYKATISSKYMIPYSKNSTQFKIYDTNGNIISSVEKSGFPFVAGDRIFVMLPGGSGFECIDKNGLSLTRYLHTSPLTAFNSGKKLTIAGFADGKLCTFNQEMEEQYNLNPGGSDTQVILGANVSQDGNYFACVSGQNNQRFVLYKNEDNHAKIIHHRFLKKSIVHQTLVYFSNDESTVYYNDADGLGIIDIAKLKYSHINIPGTILNIQESPIADSVYILSKKRQGTHNIYTLTILEDKIRKTSSFTFEADSAFILTDENSLFIGKDTKISKLIISKE